MRKLWAAIIVFSFFSCSNLVNEPENLLSEKEMAEILAEFAVNDQLGFTSGNFNLDNATRYTLQKRKVKSQDFIDSYKYYTATGKIDDIFDDSQEVIMQKSPQSKEYIRTKLKEKETRDNNNTAAENTADQTMQKQ